MWTTVVNVRHFFCLTMLTCGLVPANPLFSSLPPQPEVAHRPCHACRRLLEEVARVGSSVASGWERGQEHGAPRLGSEAATRRWPGRARLRWPSPHSADRDRPPPSPQTASFWWPTHAAPPLPFTRCHRRISGRRLPTSSLSNTHAERTTSNVHRPCLAQAARAPGLLNI
jgi:hypothetical protein